MGQPRVCGRATGICCAPDGRGWLGWRMLAQKQIPEGKVSRKSKNEGKSNSKSKRRSRFPAGMTTRKARAKARTRARARAKAKGSVSA